MDSDSTCPIGGKHKPVRALDGEECCRKCGVVLAKPEAVDFNAQKGDYKLGGKIGKKGIGWKKITPHITYDPDYKKILVHAEHLIRKYTEKVSSQQTISSRTLELFNDSRKLLKGKDTETFVAACLHIACREQEIPSSPIIIAELTGVKRDRLNDIFNQILKLHNIALPLDKAANKVRYVASKASIPEFFSRKAIKILDRIPSSEAGSNPTGIAAAMLYLVCEDTVSFVTQKQLAGITLMNPQTISNSVRLLRKVLKKYKIKI